jgi:hypothetical protein
VRDRRAQLLADELLELSRQIDVLHADIERLGVAILQMDSVLTESRSFSKTFSVVLSVLEICRRQIPYVLTWITRASPNANQLPSCLQVADPFTVLNGYELGPTSTQQTASRSADHFYGSREF